MTATWTILSGLALLVIGNIMIRSFIDPIYEVRKLRGEIADALIYHARTYLTPHTHKTEESEEAADTFRSLGSKLEARSHVVPFYGLFAAVRAVPDRKAVERARSNLIGLSNSLAQSNIEHSERHRKEVVAALKLVIPE
jgi:hypothetical protein